MLFEEQRFFLQYLVHPATKEPLQINTDTLDSSTHRFEIIENVPQLLIKEQGSSQHYKNHYETDALAFDYNAEEKNDIEYKRLRQLVLHNIPKEKGLVLDIGCGNAWLAKSLTTRGYRVISMDISTTNPIKALQSHPHPNHFAITADAFALPFKENSIDCIVAVEVIEHLPNPTTFIACLLDCLKPGGSLIITTPFNETIQHSLCIHCNQKTPHHAHLHSFTKAGIISMVPSTVQKKQSFTFHSKWLFYTHIHWLLQKTPFGLWNFIDKIALRISSKAHRLALIIKK